MVHADGELTQAKLKQILNYDPETGIFEWKVGKRQGKPTGILSTPGYLQIVIDHRWYGAHRLAFLFMTGSWPDGIVDHKDCVRTNNRWDNLRTATPSQNCANRVSQSAVGLKGVYKHRRKYKAQLGYKIGGKSYCEYLGLFPTAELAHAAYVEATKKRYGEYARGA